MSVMGLIRRQPKQPQGGPGGPGGLSAGPPVPARLREITASGQGAWQRGALYLSPGSLLWAPDKPGSTGQVELATAAMVTVIPGQPGPPAGAIDLDTPSGRVQLEIDPVLFEMSQELVAGASS
jgi:hypothetical protein